MSGRDRRVYAGNLPPDVREKDVEDIFSKYGKIEFVDLKNRKGPPFAFIEFTDARDAEDAVRGRDGYDFDGYKLRVEFPRGGGPRGPGGRHVEGEGRDSRGDRGDRGDRGEGRGGGFFRGGGGGHRGDRNGGGGGGRGGGGVGRRTNFRVTISGLPPSGSWQDLKDHMREAGDVCYADVFRDGTGAVEYLKYDDMKYALRKLDDTKFRSHEGETTYIRVKEDSGERAGSGAARNGRGRSRSASPARRARASPTYSPAKRSPSRSASRSRSRSRS